MKDFFVFTFRDKADCKHSSLVSRSNSEAEWSVLDLDRWQGLVFTQIKEQFICFEKESNNKYNIN